MIADGRFAPFLTEISLRDLPEGPLLSARFNQASLAEVTLPFEMPEALNRAVDKRRAEFAAGRLLAHLAQLHIGKDPVSVEIGGDRSPRWPKGLTGSLTHSNELAAVWITQQKHVSLGLDLEPLLAGDGLRAVRARVLTTKDHDVVGDDPWLATLTFSAKETLYKALYPKVQRFFGFEAAEVLEITDDRVSLRLTQPLTDAWRAGHQFDIVAERLEGFAQTRLAVVV